MINRTVIICSFLIIIAMVIVVSLSGNQPSATITDYGSLSISLNYQISAKPTNTIIPALRSMQYKTGDSVDWVPVQIHNGLNIPVYWDIKYAEIIKPSYYWVAEYERAIDKYGDYILCSPPPEEMQYWVVIHDQLPIKIEANETKDVLITFDVPLGIVLPEIWEFRLHYENLSQSGNVLCAYDQIWQIKS